MLRIGIIGSDNSHAEAFSALTNLERDTPNSRIDGAKVTHIYGTDPVRTKEVADKSKIPNIVDNMEDMIGDVDAVLCVWRHGSKHLHDVMPFIKAKKPVFVDKPLASSVSDARQMIEAAQQAGIAFTSFSTLRFAQSTVSFIADLKATAGELTQGVSTGPAETGSEYDGIFFYGIHGVELMHATFGYGCESVLATAHGGSATGFCKFNDGRLVTLNFVGPDRGPHIFHVMAFGKNGWKEHLVDSSTSYFDGMNVFLECFRTGVWPLTPEQLLEPVQVLAAFEKSLAEKREVFLSELG